MERLFWFHFPGMVYAGSVLARSEREVRSFIRTTFGLNRVPNHTSIWSSK